MSVETKTVEQWERKDIMNPRTFGEWCAAENITYIFPLYCKMEIDNCRECVIQTDKSKWVSTSTNRTIEYRVYADHTGCHPTFTSHYVKFRFSTCAKAELRYNLLTDWIKEHKEEKRLRVNILSNMVVLEIVGENAKDQILCHISPHNCGVYLTILSPKL